MTKRIITIGTMLIGIGLLVVACATPTPTAAPTSPPPPPEPTSVPVATEPEVEIPYLPNWEGSAHNAVDTEPFRHWDEDDPAEVPTSCAKCHSTAGYQDFLGVDGSEAGKVDAAVPAANAQGIQCVACHNAGTISKTTVMFPSGVEIKAGDDVRCMECHQGRESKVSVDKAIALFGENVDPDAVPAPVKDDKGNDVKLGFRNIHYFAAASTLYGGMTKGGYEY